MPHTDETELPTTVAIIDYGLGNLFSVKSACEAVGLRAVFASTPKEIEGADAVILPGMGAFGNAMHTLQRLDLVHPLKDVAASGRPLIGICLGLQLFMSESEEFSRTKGLGLIPGPVVRFSGLTGADGPPKVPLVGWNAIRPRSGADWTGSLLEDVPPETLMYFVHSFHAVPDDPTDVLARSTYGGVEFCAALRRGNVMAFQFHPERSGPVGLRVYRKIAALCRANIDAGVPRATT